MRQDAIQENFKTWCRVTNVSQKHVIICIELNNYGIQTDKDDVKYEEIFKPTVSNQIKIMKKFKEDISIRDKMVKKWIQIQILDQVTLIYISMCALWMYCS